MRRIVILPAAKRDLIEIGDFIALDNPERALSFVAEIEAKMTAIAERPDRFPARDEPWPLTTQGEGMFAGIDIASERHTLARLDEDGAPIGKSMTITEDREGYDALLKALGPPPSWSSWKRPDTTGKNLFAALTAAGHEVALLNPFVARRFQDSSLERTKTDAIDAPGLARLGFEKRPAPTRLHDEVAESLRELVRHRDRLRQDFDDRHLHRLVDLVFPEFSRPASRRPTARQLTSSTSARRTTPSWRGSAIETTSMRSASQIPPPTPIAPSLDSAGRISRMSRSMIDQEDANSFVVCANLHDRLFEGWGTEKTLHIIAESVGFSGHTQGIPVEFAIPVLVMK